MSGNITDRFTETFNGQNPTSTTVANPRAILGSTLVCQSLAGWPTNTAVHFATYQKDSTNAKIAGSQTDWKGVVSGSSINSLTRQGGAADGGNGVGDIVEMMPTYSWAQDLAVGLELQHNEDGSHKNITTNTLVVTSGTTLPAGDIGTADIADSAITPAKLQPGTGTTWPWQSWVPVATNFTVGGGTWSGNYIQIGKTVHFTANFSNGGSSALGTNTYISLPVNSSSHYNTSLQNVIGDVMFCVASGNTLVQGMLAINSTSAANHAQLLLGSVTNATYVEYMGTTSTIPATLNNAGNYLAISGTYEAA